MSKLLRTAVLCFLFAIPSPGQTVAKTTGTNGGVTCSYYSSRYNGRRTASGQRFSNNKLTAASKIYPIGTKLRLTNTKNGKTAVVVVNDRGPFVLGRDISVTRRAARQLGFARAGLAQVSIDVISH